MAESPPLTPAQERRLGRLRGYLPRWIAGRGSSTADHAGLAQLQAWQWALIEHLALEGVAGEEALAAWRRRRDALQGTSDPWDFILDAVEANQRSRRHDQDGAVDCFRRTVARLKVRCESARRMAGYDDDGHDLEFLRLALAVASTRLATLLASRERAVEAKTDLDEAEGLLREACDLCPREIFVRETLVWFLLQQRRWDEAEACAREIATVDTSAVAQQESHRILGDVHSHLAGWAEAGARFADTAKHLERAAASYKASIASDGKSIASPLEQTVELHERLAEGLAAALERQALLALCAGRDAEAVRRLQTELERLEPEDADEPASILRSRILRALVLTSCGGEGDLDLFLEQLRIARRSERASAALPDVARLARDLHDRPDIRRRLRLELFRRALHDVGTPARRDIAHAQLELFAQPPRRSAPFVSLVTELMVEFDPECFEPDGGETVLPGHVEALRQRLSATYGFELPPPVRVRPGDYAWPKNLGYLLFVRESTVIHGQLSHGRDLYIGPVRAFREAGIPHTTHAPPGLSGGAAWVPRTQRPALEELGLERVTPLRLLVAHLETVIEANLSRLVGREQVHRLFDLHGLSPCDVAPYSTAATVGALTRLVTALLAERIPVRAFAAIHGAAVRGLASKRPLDAVVDELRPHLVTGVEPRTGSDTPAEVEVSGREVEAPSRKKPVPEPGRSARALPEPHQVSRRASPARGIAAEAVPLAVCVELPASCGAADRAWCRAVRRRLTRRADDLVDALRLPARCQIEVNSIDELPFGMPHAMKVEGRPCRVRRLLEPDGEVDPATAAERAFATLFDGRCLLATDSITRAIAADPRLRATSDAEKIARRLLRCSLTHGVAVDRLLDRWPSVAREAVREEFMSHALELLVAELATPELPVRIATKGYDALTAREAPPHLPAANHGLSDWREDLRTKLFFELGFWVPPLVLQPDPGLGENEMALQLNDAPMPARRVFGDEVRRQGNEVQRQEDELRRQELESAILDEVARVAACFLDIRTVEQILADLYGQRFHPRLVADLLEEFDICSVLGVFRELVRERCSIRDQRAIIEALLASRDLWCGEAAPAADRPSAEDLLRLARLALMPQLTAQHARHLGSVPTFVVDPELTARITADPRLSEEERSRLLDAVQRAKAAGVPVGTPPLVIADPVARPRLRRLIEVEFPDLPVLAEQELEPKVRVQPLAILRI